MTNAERILAEIRAHPGLTDGELRVRTGIEPHQQVNHDVHVDSTRPVELPLDRGASRHGGGA